MVIQYNTINKIKFPVYVMPSENWSESDGLLFLDGRVIDDRNMPGDTLGIRRIQTPHPVGKLNKQLDDFRGILKSEQKTFIDTHGQPFVYYKTTFCKLKYVKIRKAIKKDTTCLLYLEGRGNKAFMVPRPPPDSMKYAGMLYLGKFPWVLYEYSEVRHKDTRRKV